MGMNSKVARRALRAMLASIGLAAGLVGLLTAEAAQTQRIDRDVTIAVNRDRSTFFGHVLSSRPSTCASGARVYVLQKRAGTDKRLAGTFASAPGGRWHVTLGGQDGHRLYARVPRLVTRGKHGRTICRAAVSPVVSG
jgi:hypothetical protein